MYRQLSSSRTGSALLCRASSHKRYNSDFQLMTKKAKFRKIRFKPFSKDGNYNPWFDTVQSRSGTIFTQCIQQFPSSETLRPIQNAYSQQSMSSTSTKNRTCWVFVFWSFQSRKAQPVLVSLYLKQLYLYAASTFGYTNAWAAEFTREQVKIVKQLGDRKQVLVMRLLRQFKRRHLKENRNFCSFKKELKFLDSESK